MSCIYQADALELLPTLEKRSVDVIITSPRYNFNKKYPGVNDKTPMGEYFHEMRTLGSGLMQVAQDDAVFFLNVGCRSADPLHDLHVVQCFLDVGWVLQERIIWQKANDEGGHFTPINSDVYLNNLWESIFLLTKTGKVPIDRLAIGVPYKDMSNVTRWQHGKSVHCGGDVWLVKYETITNREKDRSGHEATFPRELVMRCLRLVEKGRTNLTVLDPCCGIGTVPCIAVEQGHTGIGIDLSPEMAEVSAMNLEKSMLIAPAE